MLRTIVSYAIASALTVVMLGHLLRDRTLLLQLIMFVPVWPIALTAFVWDLALRGRSFRVRWLLTAAALGCAALAFDWQWQPALASETDAASLRVLQWNTEWGAAFEGVLHGIDEQHPDIACLSEAPPDTRALELAWAKRHPGWFIASAVDTSGPVYPYNLTVLSRFPVQKREDWVLTNGHATLFELELPARVLRVLMVDLQSSPFAPRSPSLRQVAQLLDTHAPIDLVLGDFNTPARFLGFDALAAAGGGYRLASRWSGHWRGTWPAAMRLPFLDIDHIWVGKHYSVQSSQFFISYSDHRGQRVDLSLR